MRVTHTVEGCGDYRIGGLHLFFHKKFIFTTSNRHNCEIEVKSWQMPGSEPRMPDISLPVV